MEGSKALKRINNELKEIQENPPLYWRVVKINDLQWVVWMDADVMFLDIIQDFSPFYGIPIKVHVKFPEKYPFEKPAITLDNFKIFFHANISPHDGRICHKIIQSDQMISIRERIEALRNLFSTPNFDSPLNSTAASMNKEDNANNTKHWFKKSLRIFRGLEMQ